jgi:hypothetical protein
VKIEKIPVDFQTPAEVLVEGPVIRVFRSDGNLKPGDWVSFKVNVCREGDEILLIGPTYTFYDNFVAASYVEAYLNGAPPQCEVPLDEWAPLETPSEEPRLTVEELEHLVKATKRKRKWWPFWSKTP